MINKPFFAKFSKDATWLSDLEIESPMREMLDHGANLFEEDHMEIDEVA